MPERGCSRGSIRTCSRPRRSIGGSCSSITRLIHSGVHLGDPLCILVQQQVNPIVERHGVQLVLAGHEHGYERTFPLRGDQQADASGPCTTYLITGGGGAGLTSVGSIPQCVLSVSAHNYLRVDVTGTALTFSAIGLDGIVLDRVTLNPPPVLAPGGIVNARNLSASVSLPVPC